MKLKGMEMEETNTCEIEQDTFFLDSITANLSC